MLSLTATKGDLEMNNSPLAIARACLQAYVDKDRAVIEALIDDDRHDGALPKDLASPCSLDRGDVYFLHRHHCREGAFCLSATSRERIG